MTIRTCARCGKRPCRFKTKKRKHHRADKHHDLCIRCYRSEEQRWKLRTVETA